MGRSVLLPRLPAPCGILPTREEFLALVNQRVGLPVRVLSGVEEARLSYLGVISGLNIEPESTVVVDVGGGSTVLIWIQSGRLRMASVKAGAVRLTGAGGRCELAAILRPALSQVRQPGAVNPGGSGRNCYHPGCH